MRQKYLGYQARSYMKVIETNRISKQNLKILQLADGIVLSDWKKNSWLNLLKLNEDWWIVVSEESLVKCDNLSNKWRSILEDNNLLFLYVL